MINISDNIFRGYDLRGLVDKELNEQTVTAIAKGYGTFLLQRRIYDCVVGHDSRLSSPVYRDYVIKALNECGITVYDIGITLSQIAYFAQYYFRTRGMIMITASHNPPEYNGFKFGTGYSETMITEEIVNLRDLVKQGKFLSQKPKGKHIKKDIFNIYKKDILSRVGKIRKFKVVVDSCAATTGLFLPTILREVGCEVIEQNTTLDGTFPVGVADPTEKEVQERLARRVLKEKVDLGFSYDTDGDRVGVVDSDGNLIWNDTLVSLYSKDVLDFLPGSKIVYNALCSKQVNDVIVEAGGKPVVWVTGHSFIKAKVKEVKAPFGGELSGHFFFVDNFYGHDDGAMASLRLLSYLSRINLSLKQAIAKLPQYVSSPEIKVGCPDKIKFELVSKNIGAELKNKLPRAKFLEIDGVRADLPEAMVIVRASQNGPYLTVKFEAKSKQEYNRLKDLVKQTLTKFKEIDFKEGVNTSSLD